jgi:Spy/CpxP family protein refolding chaperone
MNKRVIVATALAGIAFLAGNRAYAQDRAPQQAAALVPSQGLSDEDISLLRKDIRSMKKQIIAANVNLTETEAQQFWPIYDRYMAEMVKIVDKKFDLLKEYAANYNSMTDEQADTYIKGRAAVEDALVQLRLKYMPIFRKVLSGKTAARFTQIDWRLSVALDMQLNSQVPIIEP